MRNPERMTIYTIGHSTRSLEDFIGILTRYEIATLADVRRFPASRRHPHFSRAQLEAAVENAGIHYLHFEELGGRRATSPESPNTVWKNESFRGYADHMATEPFRTAIETLLNAAPPPAILCAEAVPWRCHRNLIADELTRRGLEVVHILGSDSTKVHTMNPAAVDAGGHLTYPAGRQERLRF